MPSEWENNSSSSSAKVSSSSGSSLSASSSTATSPEPNSNGNNNNNDSAKNGHAKDCALKASTMSHDPTPYVARARVTRPTPPKPSCNPMQFVQIKPCNLYQSAQQQLKKVEEIKKVKEVLKEEPEDWQNNLDNWKSSRRKRVEHIIERVVEVKKLELEEHDRTRRKSKTFSEMMEERGERGRTRPKLQSLASYNEDEANDLSDLGIGTSSASGKSSISEDCEVHSIVSEPPDVEHLSSFDIENNSCQPCQDNLDRISSLGGYETSSTAPITSPDPYEYTYEGAIEDYKSRVSKASAASSYKKPEFENRKSLIINDDNNDQDSSIVVQVKKEDLPKIDISKKRELFENQNQEAAKVTSSMQNNHEQMEKKRIPSEFTNVRSIKDRLCSLEKKPIDSNPNTDESSSSTTVVATEILPGEVYSIKERMQCLKQHNSVNPKPNINKVVAEVVSVPPLKDRLSSLQNAVTKEEIIKKPVVLVDEYQLEMLKNEDMARRQLVEQSKDDSIIIVEKAPSDDSGINTTDEKIDHEPATTEDEDDDDDADDDDDDITVAMTAPIPSKFNEEKLKNLNTPTVVSLVDKPVVVNDDHNHDDVVVGGGGVDDGGGVGKVDVVVNPKNNDNDEVCEINEALELALQAIDLEEDTIIDMEKNSVKSSPNHLEAQSGAEKTPNISPPGVEPIYENISSARAERDDRMIYNLPPPPPLPLLSSSSSSDAIIVETIQKVSNTTIIERDIFNSSSISSSSLKIDEDDDVEEEPYYQVPKSCEPLYQVPKLQKPIPLYENIEMFCTARGDEYSAAGIPLHLQPPKEKPPPPPIMDVADSDADADDDETGSAGGSSTNTYETIPRGGVTTDNGGANVPPIMRMNSTKRIKNEIRNKRSSFLGIEGSDDSFLELTVAPPPDMVQLLQEERRLDKQLCIKAGLYDNSDAGESRDSGVSENHSRQSSEPFTNSSDEPDHHEELLAIHARMNHNAEQQQRLLIPQNQMIPGMEEANAKIQCIEDQIREQEEVLRVERELLQVEQDELKRQRDNLILRENMARRELQHGAKILMSNNRRSLQDINATINMQQSQNNNNSNNNIYANIQNQQVYQIETDYCRSMSDLPDFRGGSKLIQQMPPMKPTRSQMISDEHVQMRMSQPNVHHMPPVVSHGNMTRNALHALSATPKPKYNDAWVHTKKEFAENKTVENGWVSYQQKRKSVPDTFSYNNHWLVQEAEQRRIEQQRGLRNTNGWTRGVGNNNIGVPPNTQTGGNKDNKPLPDAVIQTLTQRVQSKGIGERKRFDDSHAGVPNHQIGSQSILHNSSPTRLLEKSVTQHQQQQEKILSVSGKKKCSHCGDELENDDAACKKTHSTIKYIVWV
ncbi:uncharacterized protein LOC129913661 isoform X4 [Episyrphus balteatus]|uniref:uncharacterized protein LOC129913661 isoform X4 n=1 Tax=Episyrphus balteatus TaxID=286459 RepID=UPI0024867E99|nr:uncharacterized protein LOC129913661 isoform X4 [Episyrphus balteatus]